MKKLVAQRISRIGYGLQYLLFMSGVGIRKVSIFAAKGGDRHTAEILWKLRSQTLAHFAFSLVMARREDCRNMLDTIGTLNGAFGSHIG